MSKDILGNFVKDIFELEGKDNPCSEGCSFTIAMELGWERRNENETVFKQKWICTSCGKFEWKEIKEIND